VDIAEISRWITIAAIGLAFTLRAHAADNQPLPQVRPGHPRLLVTGDDLPRLRKQVAAYPDLWERMKDLALQPPSDPGYGDGRGIRTAALVYLITGEEQYLRPTIARAENIARNHTLDQYGTPEALFGLALAYDWCYPGLSASQRQEISGAMLRMAEYCRDKIWRHSDFNNHFVLEKVWPFVYTGAALAGDVDDPRVAEFLRLGDEYLHQHLIPAANLMADDTGGQHEGYGYDLWGYARPAAYVMEAWRTATGEDLFPTCTATRYFALWNIYGRRPFDGMQEHFDDADLDLRWGADDVYAYLFAARYRDGHAQWMGDQIERRYDTFLWPIILWRDPDLAPRGPDDLPLARRFDGLGWVLMRSSWQSDATFASFQCGPVITGHQHLDNNSFTIHKGGLLAIDPGINAYGERIDDKYRANYYSRTIAHNTITVYDPSETFPDGAWGGGEPKGANDGGQLRPQFPERVEELTPGNRWDAGRIVAYAHQPLFTYAVGDATKSYSPKKLKRFLRHFLYLPPDLFVIFDQVSATDASFRKAWLLHTVSEPDVKGNLIRVTNGDATLICRTVLPQSPTITTVGGHGKERWVDGRDWPSLEKTEWPPEAGAWRVEVSPSLPSQEDLFLHVLQAGSTDIAAPGAVTLIHASGEIGVRVLAQGREYEATFSQSGAPTGHLRITDRGKVLIAEQLR
jgi:heparin/heparan-sulfate lyase